MRNKREEKEAGKMTKMEAYREAVKLEKGFLANVILNHHSNPAKKLKGLMNLIHADHTVEIGSFDIDCLAIDGHRASWVVLEEWATRKVCTECGRETKGIRENGILWCRYCGRRMTPKKEQKLVPGTIGHRASMGAR